MNNTKFVCLTERNDWEGETYRHYFDSDLFADEIAQMDEFINELHRKDCLSYSLDISKTLTRTEVGILLSKTRSGYIAFHNLAIAMDKKIGSKKNGELIDPFYKGNGIRTGDWDDLVVAKRWSIARPGQSLPLFLAHQPGWAHQIHKDGKPTDKWLILGRGTYAFGRVDSDKKIAIDLELLETSTGRLVRIVEIEHGGSKDMLKYVKKVTIGGHYSQPDGSSLFKPSENLTYLCFEEVYRLPGLACSCEAVN